MMIEIATSMIPKLIGAFKDLLEDPDTYKKAESFRKIFEQLTGREIKQSVFLEFLEEATQGEAYTGEWELLDEETQTRRMRWAGGWVLHIKGSNPIFIPD
jgi:hypothetical protein